MFETQCLISNHNVTKRNWQSAGVFDILRDAQILGEVSCQSYRYRIVNESGLISVLDWIDDENDADYCIPSWTEFSE